MRVDSEPDPVAQASEPFGASADSTHPLDDESTALLETLPGIIVYRSRTEPPFEVEFLSEAVSTVAGYPTEDFVGTNPLRRWTDLIHADDRDRVYATLAETREIGRTYEVEYRMCRADGTEAWILARGQRVVGADGTPWLHGAAIDVTDRHRAEELRRSFEAEDARRAELDATRQRIVEAAQDERRRLERNLHDGAQQRLVSLMLDLGLLESRFKLEPKASKALDQVRSQLAESLQELRDLARGIHPAIVTEYGLAVAVESLAARASLSVDLSIKLEARPPERVEIAAYYVVSESLTNAAKYAQASRATVAVWLSSSGLVVEITDDGVGGANAAGGSGLRGLADRVAALGGQLHVWSPAGSGTRVQAEIPCG